MQQVWLIIRLVTGISLFLYGFRLLSGGIQKYSGSYLRTQLMRTEGGRLQRLYAGGALSFFMCSTAGSAGSLVGLVNSGLHKIPRAYDTMVGVNLGGIGVMWLVTLLGFGIPFSLSNFYSGVLLGVSLFFLLWHQSRMRYLGEMLLGCGLVLWGVNLFHTTSLEGGSAFFLYWQEGLMGLGFWSLFISYGVGFVLSFLLSSSVGAFVIAQSVFMHHFLLPLHGMALVLGVNCGSAFSVYLGGRAGNPSARNLACFHLLYNLYGVCWMLVVGVYLYYLEPRTWSRLVDPEALTHLQLSYLPLIHTLLNMGTGLQWLILHRWAEGWLRRSMRGTGEGGSEAFHLRNFTMGLHPMGEIVLLQAQEMTLKYARRTYRMLGFVRSLFEAGGSGHRHATLLRIEKYGRISVRVEREIASFLGDMSWGDLSEGGRRQLGSLLRINGGVANLAQEVLSLARVVQYKEHKTLWFNAYVVGRVHELFEVLDEAFGTMEMLLHGGISEEKAIEAMGGYLLRLYAIRDAHRARWVDDITHAEYTAEGGVLVTEFIMHCVQMGHHFVQIAKALEKGHLPRHKAWHAEHVWRKTMQSARVHGKYMTQRIKKSTERE